MILITGGAGFIGSNLHAALAAEDRQVVLCDRLHDGDKWRNLRHHPPLQIVPPDDLPDWLDTGPPLDAIVHLGAISATTARDGDLVWRSNVTLSQFLWQWCVEAEAKFIYASSAATYGDGSAGFEDDASLAYLQRLRPLNLYGWSKHAFDLWAVREAAAGRAPPSWAGVKFFNVYGPNEYHKGAMVSVVKVKHDELLATGGITLFRSEVAAIPDGHQSRDFIWIGDAVAALMHLAAADEVSGLFNLGTGTARSYLDVARGIIGANGAGGEISFATMPAALRGQYQSFTQAPMHRLAATGFAIPPTSLEDGIARYVRDYLLRPDPYA